MTTLDELFADRDLHDHMEVPVLLNTDVADRIALAEHLAEEARDRHERAMAAEADRMVKPQTDAAKQALDETEAEVGEAREAAIPHMVYFRFTSLPADTWEKLLLDHPPTKKHREEHGRGLKYNPDTFPTVAVAACLTEVVQPDGTAQPVGDGVRNDDGTLNAAALADAEAAIKRTIKAKVKQAVWQQIWGATWRVNVGVSKVPPSLLGSPTTPGSDGESEPQ